MGAGRGVALKGEGAAEAQKGEKGEDLGDSNYSEFYGLDTPSFILDYSQNPYSGNRNCG